MGRLTTHVLDTARGCPGRGIRIELFRVQGRQLEWLGEAVTNQDGRCDEPLLQGDAYRSGVYQLQVHAGEYFAAQAGHDPDPPTPAFLDVVVVRFGLDAEQPHYHVPLLVSPYSYSTYRGS